MRGIHPARDEQVFSRNSRIKAAIAQNPNSPPDLLVELSGRYLEEIGENPALELILLEDPNFLQRVFEYDMLKLGYFTHGYKPLWYLEKAKKHSDHRLRDSVASSVYSPTSFLKELIKDPDLNVRLSVTSNKNTPVSLLLKALLDRKKKLEKKLEKDYSGDVFLD